MAIVRPKKIMVPIVMFSMFIRARQAGAEPAISLRAGPEIVIPIQDQVLDIGPAGRLLLDFFPGRNWGFFAQGSYASLGLGNAALDRVSLYAGDLGASYRFKLGDRLGLRANLYGGLYGVSWQDIEGASGISAGVGMQCDFKISPSTGVSAFGSYDYYAYSADPFMQSVSAGVSISINVSELLSPRARVGMTVKKQDPVFPVFFAYYDEFPFGEITVKNLEPNAITDVKTSFLLDEFMSQPKVCSTGGELAVGATVDVALKAFFNESILEQTEETIAEAKVIIDYKSLGESKQAILPVRMPVYHRNAMSWDDDRRVAAFVSSKDPAALWFSKYVAAMVQERLRGTISPNMQYAAGMFEALKSYGLSYVVDPTSAYADNTGKALNIDFLQYPYQTLAFRGGDCDDLSILYCSLFEAIGIETAFLTIPGHIYMAFSLGISEEEAKRDFYDPALLIFHQGKAWVPLEITLTRETFNKAWRLGAKEWQDASARGTAKIYPVRDAWKIYKPVSIPGAAARFRLPDQHEVAAAYEKGLDAYVQREIGPQIDEFEKKLAETSDPASLNEFGILYGKYGMLNLAQAKFERAAAAGYVYSINNIGNIFFTRKEYQNALLRYQDALGRQPGNAEALLGLARCYYELEDFTLTDKYYGMLQSGDETLASKYGYLGSFFVAEGRAYSLSERLLSLHWSRPEVYRAPGAVVKSPDPVIEIQAVAPTPVPLVEPPAASLVPEAKTPEELPAIAPAPATVSIAAVSVPVPEPVAIAVDVPSVVVEPAPEPLKVRGGGGLSTELALGATSAPLLSLAPVEAPEQIKPVEPTIIPAAELPPLAVVVIPPQEKVNLDQPVTAARTVRSNAPDTVATPAVTVSQATAPSAPFVETAAPAIIKAPPAVVVVQAPVEAKKAPEPQASPAPVASATPVASVSSIASPELAVSAPLVERASSATSIAPVASTAPVVESVAPVESAAQVASAAPVASAAQAKTSVPAVETGFTPAPAPAVVLPETPLAQEVKKSSSPIAILSVLLGSLALAAGALATIRLRLKPKSGTRTTKSKGN